MHLEQSRRKIRHIKLWVYAHRRFTFFICICIVLSGTFIVSHDAEKRYSTLLSNIIYDTHGLPLRIKENSKGLYVLPLSVVPDAFQALLIAKEDRWYYYHPGINPFSFIRALYNRLVHHETSGGSTITQQLAKNLLGTESKRTFSNKLYEALYAISLEIWMSKDNILHMYTNTVFLGNQIQGFETASLAYFNAPLQELSIPQQLSLLATLSHPTSRNPWEHDNALYAAGLHSNLHIDEPFVPPQVTQKYSSKDDAFFELDTAGVACITTCTTTIDARVTNDLRAMLARHIDAGRSRGARNGAIVVIDPKQSKLIAMVGSPDPLNTSEGNQINMALEPRPIGSTVKPLLYLKGFMEGLRPYTRVDDREYKYPIATGFSLYPKNYDGKYHGTMTLHQALSNSLNVPSVKVLEYIGLENFYRFLRDTLRFTPIQDLNSYQYGIALGGLEMDLVTLTHYFSVFPRGGTLAPLRTIEHSSDTFNLPPQSRITESIMIADKKFTELVEVIISDRLTGVDQFGLESNLNLNIEDYAVKTGTSRDFHDSWVVGYTPDFVVGVWIGNAENKPLEQVSGVSGAGAVWHDAMEYLLSTSYNHTTKFSHEHIRRLPIGISDEWGLPDDIQSEHEMLLQESSFVTSIHEADVFEYTPNISIPLRAKIPVIWKINGVVRSSEQETIWNPTEIGKYEVEAFDTKSGTREIINITINEKA